MATTVTQIRIDEDLKQQATEIFEELGLDLPTAIRIFLKRSVMQNGIPFSMTLPKSRYKSERAVRALEQLQEQSESSGISNMTLEEINEQIAAARGNPAKKRDGK